MLNRIFLAVAMATCFMLAAGTTQTKVARSFAFEKAEACLNTPAPQAEKDFVFDTVVPLIEKLSVDDYFGRRRLFEQDDLEQRIDDWLEDHEQNGQSRRLDYEECYIEEIWYLFEYCEAFGVPATRRGLRGESGRDLSTDFALKIDAFKTFDFMDILHTNSVCERVLLYLTDSFEFTCVVTDPPFCNFQLNVTEVEMGTAPPS